MPQINYSCEEVRKMLERDAATGELQDEFPILRHIRECAACAQKARDLNNHPNASFAIGRLQPTDW